MIRNVVFTHKKVESRFQTVTGGGKRNLNFVVSRSPSRWCCTHFREGFSKAKGFGCEWQKAWITIGHGGGRNSKDCEIIMQFLRHTGNKRRLWVHYVQFTGCIVKPFNNSFLWLTIKSFLQIRPPLRMPLLLLFSSITFSTLENTLNESLFWPELWHFLAFFITWNSKLNWRKKAKKNIIWISNCTWKKVLVAGGRCRC